MRKELDKTIKAVSKRVQVNEIISAETLKALASLVKARARMK